MRLTLLVKTCHCSRRNPGSDSPSAGSYGSSSHENWMPVQTTPCPPPSTHQGRGWSLGGQRVISRCCVCARRACREPAEHRRADSYEPWTLRCLWPQRSQSLPAQHCIRAFLSRLQCTRPLWGEGLHYKYESIFHNKKCYMTKTLQKLTFRINYCVIWRPNQHATIVFITVFCGTYKIPTQKVCIPCQKM